ncbi:MAG: tetratricopeptide repeat protein [Magnetococcales bacterium]|nr:tetratricopeptide repeat protein [Magnetococcales bacterium]MBF0114868.1 tetratricopeptide repeat protein [Magnetococcales bacterium]
MRKVLMVLLGLAGSGVLQAAPAIIQEETLTGREWIGGQQPFLSVPLARRLLASGSPRLVLRVADEVLNRGGAPLLAADWVRLKAEALLLLERHEPLQVLLQEVPEETRRVYPDLELLLAVSDWERGACEEAHRRFAAFLLANPQHPKRLLAQWGLGMCALALHRVEEAELQLQLYEQEAGRPKQDGYEMILRAEMARYKGQGQEEGRWMGQLAEISLPGEVWQRRARWLVLARWEAGQKHWNTAIAWLESGLRHEGSLPRLVNLHTQIMRQWLAGNDSGAVAGEQRQLAENVRRAAEQRMAGIRQLLRAEGKGVGEVGRRYLLLEQLVRKAVNDGVAAIVDEGGILSAGQLWPSGEWPELYRVAYAGYEREMGHREHAWEWLEGVTQPEAEGERLLLLAGCAGTPGAVLHGVVERLARLSDWPEGLREKGFRALFLLTGQSGRQGIMLRLRDLLAALTPQSREVQRALAYHQAVLWQAEGVQERALLEWLQLAAMVGKPEEDRYLPGDPRRMAAALLEAQGWPAAAQELRVR